MTTAAAPYGNGLAYLKGHGTGNDFVVVPDPEGAWDLPAALVVAVCDRRSGVGGDGLLRVVRTAHAAEAYVLAQEKAAEWFMDYRNADGSVAEMCGNGVRVFVRFLLEAGLVRARVGATVPVATRAGVVPVRVEADGVLAADLGPAVVPEPQPGVTVRVARPAENDGGVGWPATAVSMPNPHAVVFVADLSHAGDLVRAPEVSPREVFPDGVNVEFVQVVEPGRLLMRVWERGVGETASCGTGACAAVVATRRRLAEEAGGLDQVPARWTVDVPGGRLRVTEHANATVELAGPAVLVSSGELRPDWLDSAGSWRPATAHQP